MSSPEQATSSTSSVSNIQLITDAFEKYAKITGKDLSKDPFSAALDQSDSPEAILELLQEREKAFREYRQGSRRLITCLSPVVNVLQAFSGVFGEAIGMVHFPPAKALFIGIDILLAAASRVTSSYDSVLNLFECLGNFLKRLEVYTTIPPTPMLTDIIVKVIVDLLMVLALTTKEINQGRFKKFVKMLWGKDKIQAVLEGLDRLTKDEGLSVAAQTLGVVHGLAESMKVVMGDGNAPTNSIRQNIASNGVNKMKRDQLHRDVHYWLSPPDPSTNHNLVSEARHSETASWFLEGTAMAEWKATGSFLWIHGKPGAGKSTLLSAVIQDIERMHATGLATMAYYYFDFRDVKKQECDGLLSSLTLQLSAESDSCYDVLSQLYSDHSRGTRRPSISALKKCMTEILRLPGQGPIYIIIDGVDECPNFPGKPSNREKVLKLIEEFVNLKLPNVHLCVASRPEMDIRIVLEQLTTLKISLHDETGQKEDIIKYIRSVVQSDWTMRRWKEEDKQLVVDTLSDKANGMFRWVVCQIDCLSRCFPASIRSALDDLPDGLDETYERTLLGIDKQKRTFARRLFQCLLVSIRPLRVEELAEILAIRFDEAAAPTFNADWRPLNVEEAVISACSSLVAIVDRGGREIVQFSHFSVKEYLTSERLSTSEERLSFYHILPEPAHTVLAHASLSVLLELDDKTDRETISRFPLALYAARHWVDHAQFKGVSSRLQEVMGRLFDPARPHFAAWIWLYDIDHHWIEPMSTIHPTRPEAVPLYYASLCGFCDFVEHLITVHSSDVNCRGGSHTTPLHAASLKGHLDVASLLLERGADPDSLDVMHRVPLHRVSQGGEHVMVESSLKIARLLINYGAKVDVPDGFEGDTPLHAAARPGYRDIAELLVESGASLDAQNQDARTPLHMACWYGRLDVSRFLIDRGSDINFRTEYGFTPLHTASQFGHVEVARLLLECGSDVNARDEASWTSLHLASGFGHLDLARLLMERGADVFAMDNNGYTPFHTTSKFGQLDIVKLLLERGVDVDIQTEKGETSLFLASMSGKLDVVRFLIEQGTDVHIETRSGWNPVHTASQNGHLDVLRLLIDTGISIDIQNEDQMTPFALASSEGKVEVGRFLIERGADINARDFGNWVPLHQASRNGHLDMVQLLLDHGVNPNIQGDDLWSPLHLASANGHLKIAELLLHHDASVDVFDDKQETPLSEAVKSGEAAIAGLLIDHGANLHIVDRNGRTLLHAASHRGHLVVVKLLLRRGADVNVLDNAGKTAVELASENGRAQVAKFIAEYKTDPNVRNKMRSSILDTARVGADENGTNKKMGSLHAAVKEGDIDVVRSLLERGADINDRDAYDRTPLHVAATKGNVEAVQLLIEWGAEVDSRDEQGWTPLHTASRFGHLEVARVLIDHGANVNARPPNHLTPIHFAAGNDHLGIAKLLLERGADVHAINGFGETPYEVFLHRGHREMSDYVQRYGKGRESPW